jgi:hypothetical protein
MALRTPSGARIEQMTEEDLARTSGAPQAPHRLDVQALEAMVNKTDSAVEAIGKLTADCDEAIKKVDSALRDDIRQQRIIGLRQHYAQKIDLAKLDVLRNAQTAELHVPHYTREAAYARAVFDADASKHASIYAAAVAKVARASESGLLLMAREAARERSVAMAAVIHDELAQRKHSADDHEGRKRRAEIAGVLNTIPTESEKVGPLLRKLRDAPLKAKIVAGKALPADKITSGLRALGG